MIYLGGSLEHRAAADLLLGEGPTRQVFLVGVVVPRVHQSLRTRQAKFEGAAHTRKKSSRFTLKKKRHQNRVEWKPLAAPIRPKQAAELHRHGQISRGTMFRVAHPHQYHGAILLRTVHDPEPHECAERRTSVLVDAGAAKEQQRGRTP